MKPTVFLFAEPESLALSLLENLLANFCSVKIFTDRAKTWRQKTGHLAPGHNLEFLSPKSFSTNRQGNYLIYLDLSPENLKDLATQVGKLAETSQAKGFLVTSYRQLDQVKIYLPVRGRVGVVYVGDLYGPRMEFNHNSRVAGLIGAALSGKKAVVTKGEKVYPAWLAAAAKTIAGWLFSFGPAGEEIFLTSGGILTEDFCRLIKEQVPGFGYVVREKEHQESVAERFPLFHLAENYPKHLREVFDYYRAAPVKPGKERKLNRNLFLVLTGAVSVLVSPLLFLALSFTFLYLSKNAVRNGHLAFSQQAVVTGRALASVANQEALLFTRVPGVGRPYRNLASLADITLNLSRAGQRTINVIQNTQELIGKVFGRTDYETGILADKLAADLDYIEKTVAFSEGEAKTYPAILARINLSRIRETVGELRKIAIALPELLGEDGRKTYLVLFQNNMELRPGGGFIGSFALLSLEKGKLVEMNLLDVYSADGQLRGHVEPPAPLKKYLNQANWFLRDSNWDVDFGRNAQKAEWFLDKEMGVAVDGVVGLDLRVAKDLLKVIGPVNLSDYQTQVTAENLYEKAQAQAEEGFFPGSTRKASFLTALGRAILAQVTGEPVANFSRLGQVLYQDLAERHLQLSLQIPAAGTALTNLGWDGVFSTGQMGTVEANLGVNKANYFITRQSFLDIFGNTWRLKIIYENKANPALGNRGVYKNYLRLVTPNTAANLTAGPYTLDLIETAGRKEAGLYFEVLPGEKKEINFLWQQPAENVISWRKQPGVEGDKATLTVNGHVVYNSTFDKDIVWINTF